MLFKLSNLNSNLALTLGCFNPALNNSAQYDNLRIATLSPFQGHLPRTIFRKHVFVLEMGEKHFIFLKCGLRGISPQKPERFSFYEAFLHAWWVTQVEVRVLEGFCLYFGLRLSRGARAGGFHHKCMNNNYFAFHKSQNKYLCFHASQKIQRSYECEKCYVSNIFIFIKQSLSIILILAS